MREVFARFAAASARALGSAPAFAGAVVVVAGWALAGPAFRYSADWQLTINTGTTIVTFLMVFVIQNTVNHDTRALHLKLDELLRAQSEARTGLVDLESLSEEQQERLQEQFSRLREREAGQHGEKEGRSA